MIPARRVASGVLLMSAAMAAVLPGCVPPAEGPADTFGLDFTGTNPAKAPAAIVFLVDAVEAGIFREMLQAGELPTVKTYFADRGLYIPRAVSVVPCITLACQTSFVTGLFPGHHGVTGNNWFDRNRLIWRNYETIAQKNTLDGDYVAATLYEQFPGRPTASLFFQAHRGSTWFVENWASAGPPFFLGAYEYVDRLALWRFGMVADAARMWGGLPAVTVVYQLATDFRAYEHGVGSPQYRQAIRHTDRQIGRVLGDLKRAGTLDSLYLVLVSDHGMSPVTRHLPVRAFLRDALGLDASRERLWESTPFEDRLGRYGQHSVVVYGNGDRYAAICLRRPAPAGGFEPWHIRPAPADLERYPRRDGRGEVNLLEALASHEGVDAVAYAAGTDRVRIRRKAGEVEFHQPAGRGGRITCRILAGQDPLGWRGKVPDAALAGEALGERQWLGLTAATDYADLPAQILAYFRAPRAGDIAVFAAPGWDFNRVHKAGHGGLGPADMHMPILIAGPGVPHGVLPDAAPARLTDVMPTILTLMGRPVPPGLDGQPLVPSPPTAPATGPATRP